MENATITTLTAQFPLVEDLIALKETTWLNPRTTTLAEGLPYVGLTKADVDDAHARLNRFAPYLAKAFPETAATGGIIESELVAIPAMKARLEQAFARPVSGDLLLKKDSHLPISGSIKARGGIYEVLTHAEKLALEAGLLSVEDDYSILLEPRFKDFFSQYSIAVGSTGNLGMSIGIMSARIGFKVTVHMSADAREWKKAKLRSHGVIVVEYEQDYGVAVEQGRKAAESAWYPSPALCSAPRHRPGWSGSSSYFRRSRFHTAVMRPPHSPRQAIPPQCAVLRTGMRRQRTSPTTIQPSAPVPCAGSRRT